MGWCRNIAVDLFRCESRRLKVLREGNAAGIRTDGVVAVVVVNAAACAACDEESAVNERMVAVIRVRAAAAANKRDMRWRALLYCCLC